MILVNLSASHTSQDSPALMDGALRTVSMPYLFLTTIAVALIAFAPLKTVASLILSIAIVTFVVKIVASRLAGPVSFGAAAKAVIWACILPALTLLVMLIQFKGEVRFEGFTGTLLFTVLFASFALGFKHSLETTFNDSATIAVISTVVAGGVLFVLKPLLF